MKKILLGSLLAIIGACGKKDDTVQPTLLDLRIEQQQVFVPIQGKKEVKITQGNQHYNLTTDTQIVTAKLITNSDKSQHIEIQGNTKGEAQVKITDTQTHQTQNLNVTVFAEFSLDAEQLVINLNDSKTLTLLQGSGYFNASIADERVATALVQDNIIVVQGKTQGETTLIISDAHSENKKQITIQVAELILIDAQNVLTKFQRDATPENGRVDLTERVHSIAKGVFKGNNDLIEVIGPSVHSIDDDAFAQCQSLEKVTFNQVRSIGKRAFSFNASLKTVQIQSPELTIGTEAFANCPELTEITLPATTQSIGSKAFFSCRALRVVRVLSAEPPRISRTSFQFTSAEKRLIVPQGSKEKYEQSAWANSFSSIEEE